jgi:hypothetical protein
MIVLPLFLRRYGGTGFEAKAVVSDLQDVATAGQAVEECSRHLGVAEDGGPDIGNAARQRCMRDLIPQRDTALFQPAVQRRKIGKARHGLPQTVLGILNVLLDLSFLPACGRIAELWLKYIVVCHCEKAHVDLPLLPATDAIDCRLRVHCPRTNGGQFPLS